MPDRRRPRLWKTLVAAGRTAIDRVADGVDVLADGVEALADGLRSLGRRLPAAPDPPPVDPRLAGVDPALAAYVAARDPVWFSFRIPDGGLPGEADTPLPRWDESPPSTEQSPPVSHETPDSAGTVRPRRTAGERPPSAAELPGGRPVPPRILFRRRTRESDGSRRSHPSAARADELFSEPRSSPGPDAGERSHLPSPRSEGPTGRGSDPVSVAPDARHPAIAHEARQSAPRPRESAEAHSSPAEGRRHTPGDSPSPAPFPTVPRAVAPATPVAFGSPSGPAGRAGRGASDTPAVIRPRSFARPDRPTRTPPRLPFPAPTDLPSARAPARQDGREAAPSTPPAARTRETPTPAPAPWPALPPSNWSPLAGDAGGSLAWASAPGSDVLVDEQRST